MRHNTLGAARSVVLTAYWGDTPMSKKRILILGLIQALGTALYVTLVAFVLNNLPFSEDADPQTSLQTIMQILVVLLLFIASASITGCLVFGYPVILALRQRVKEAVFLVAATVSWIVLLMLIAVTVILALPSHP
jgi:magnesium-transporting ATPase (P-type)